jgi:hypothetical protein
LCGLGPAVVIHDGLVNGVNGVGDQSEQPPVTGPDLGLGDVVSPRPDPQADTHDGQVLGDHDDMQRGQVATRPGLLPRDPGGRGADTASPTGCLRAGGRGGRRSGGWGLPDARTGVGAQRSVSTCRPRRVGWPSTSAAGGRPGRDEHVPRRRRRLPRRVGPSTHPGSELAPVGACGHGVQGATWQHWLPQACTPARHQPRGVTDEVAAVAHPV